jgi:L-amino acid N-acyltransferase YncA
MSNEGARQYPAHMTLGGKDIVVRYARADDETRMVTLARSLPEHDLMFLRRDLTKADVVRAWLGDPNITVILAIDGDAAVGYASVHRSETPWSAHVAELRVLIADSMRGKGLGRVLTQEAFADALGRGIEKMVAQMTLDQKGAIAVFEGLGFRPEALMRDHVKDRAGTKHDMLVLSHEVARFEAQQYAFGVTQAFEGR